MRVRGMGMTATAPGASLRVLLVTTALTAPAAALLPPAAVAAVAEDGATAAQTAQAEAQHTFAIPPQPLADALPLFGQQAGVQTSVRGDLVRDLRTAGVSGRMSAEAALQRLLAGTGLTYRFTAPNAVTMEATGVAPGGEALVLEPVRVEGALATAGWGGPADGAASIAVTREDLERRNPATMKDVFAGESGVSVGGALPLSQKVYVNGIEETNLAVQIDGARQNNKVFHHSGTNLIDPSLLKAVRIDPGVAPADAGPGALGGAISYETVDVGDLLAPGRSLGGFVTGSYATNGDTVTAGTAAYGRAAGFEVLGYVNRAVGDDYKGGHGREVAGSGADMISGLAKVAYHSDGGHRLEVSAERVNDAANRPYRANLGAITNRPEPAVRKYDMDRRTVALTYSTPDATGLWDPRVVLSYSVTDVEVPEPFDSTGRTGTLAGRIENSFNLSADDSITAGIDFYNDRARYFDATDDLDEKARNLGAYAQARLQPLDPLTLSFGLRGDRQWFEGVDGTDISNTGLSGNVSAALQVTDHIRLNAGYSNVWGGIALAENYILNPRWRYDPDMKGVRAQNYTTGVEAAYNGITASARLFRSDFSNARDESFRGGPSLTTDFETYGYSLGLGYTWGPGFVRASYTDSTIKVNGNAADSDVTQYLGAPLGRIIALEAAHSFEAIGVTVGGSIEAALKNTDTVGAGGRALPAYEVVNLHADYVPDFAPYLTLRAEANNIFDEDYADRATYGQDFTNVDPLREPGRSFLLKAKATF